LEVICLVDEIEVSENREALIVLAGTVAGAATTFVASLPIPLEIKAPVVVLVSYNCNGRDFCFTGRASQQAVSIHPLLSFLFFSVFFFGI
jgi:hypothetical protein